MQDVFFVLVNASESRHDRKRKQEGREEAEQMWKTAETKLSLPSRSKFCFLKSKGFIIIYLNKYIQNHCGDHMPPRNRDNFRPRDCPLVAGCSIAISCLFMSADGVQTKAQAGSGETSFCFYFWKKVQWLELGIFKHSGRKHEALPQPSYLPSGLLCDLCTHFLPYVQQRRNYWLSIWQNTVLKVWCG